MVRKKERVRGRAPAGTKNRAEKKRDSGKAERGRERERERNEVNNTPWMRGRIGERLLVR